MPARPLLENQSSAPAIAIAIPVRLIGLLLLALVGVMMAALASWSVDDPSLSYAASHKVQNWLGYPGAVVADLAFELLGLAVIALLVPLALWGWSFMRRRVPTNMSLRLVAWLAATGLWAGVLAFLPVPASWPLPTGLGGLIGMGFSDLAQMVTGANPQPVTAWLFAIIILAPTLALTWLAFGFGRTAGASSRPRSKGRGVTVASDAAEDTERTGLIGGLMDVAVGGLVHLGFSLKTAARRAFRKARETAAARRTAEATEYRGEPVEPALTVTASPAPATVRTEPRFEPQLTVERRVYAPEPEPAYEEPEYADDEDDGAVAAYAPVPQAAPQAAQPARPRVVAAPARPVPGNRAIREAQPSMLEAPSDGFELPELGLLAEPKHRGLADEHRPERLEAMARRLEGVLEDFGVKGDIINVRPGPVVTLYELEPAPGIKSSRVISLADDIARR